MPQTDRVVGEYLLTVEGVTAKVCIGKTKLMEMVKKGQFPMPQLIASKNHWRGSDVDGWIREQFRSLKQTA